MALSDKNETAAGKRTKSGRVPIIKKTVMRAMESLIKKVRPQKKKSAGDKRTAREDTVCPSVILRQASMISTYLDRHPLPSAAINDCVVITPSVPTKKPL
jgi:hypothetical protein